MFVRLNHRERHDTRGWPGNLHCFGCAGKSLIQTRNSRCSQALDEGRRCMYRHLEKYGNLSLTYGTTIYEWSAEAAQGSHIHHWLVFHDSLVHVQESHPSVYHCKSTLGLFTSYRAPALLAPAEYISEDISVGGESLLDAQYFICPVKDCSFWCLLFVISFSMLFF